MKRVGYITLLSSLLLVGLAYMVVRWPRTVPPAECSEVYRRYSEVEGIRASYLKDYRVNDTVTVGVTLLEAETDSGWARLQEDFEIPVLGDNEKEEITGNRSVGFKRLPAIEPKDSMERCLTTYSREKQRVCVFHIRDDAQYLALILYSLDEISTIQQ